MPTDELLGQPALLFERAHGLVGIAGQYQFPDEAGMSRLSLQQKIWSSSGMNDVSQEEMKRIFQALKAANPLEMAKIHLDETNLAQANDVVRGMVSGFNVDDINLFMKRAHGDISQVEWWGLLNDVRASEAKIMQRMVSGPSIGWIASDETLDKIWQQVKDRPILHALDLSAPIKENPAAKFLGVGIVATVAAIGGYALGRSKNKKDRSHASILSEEKTSPTGQAR